MHRHHCLGGSHTAATQVAKATTTRIVLLQKPSNNTDKRKLEIHHQGFEVDRPNCLGWLNIENTCLMVFFKATIYTRQLQYVLDDILRIRLPILLVMTRKTNDHSHCTCSDISPSLTATIDPYLLTNSNNNCNADLQMFNR